MQLHAHLGIGWTLGVLWPGSNRRLRALCVVAAVLPDIDGLTILFGYPAYERWHHTFGHNVWLGALLVVLGVLLARCRSRKEQVRVSLLLAACFGSHLLADAYFTRYAVYPLWPLSRAPFLIPGGFYLDQPINFLLIWIAITAMVILAIFRGVSPLELISSRLDQLVLDSFRKRDLDCVDCGKGCAHRCTICSAPVCLRHGTISSGFVLLCPSCQRRRDSEAT